MHAARYLSRSRFFIQVNILNRLFLRSDILFDLFSILTLIFTIPVDPQFIENVRISFDVYQLINRIILWINSGNIIYQFPLVFSIFPAWIDLVRTVLSELNVVMWRDSDSVDSLILLLSGTAHGMLSD